MKTTKLTALAMAIGLALAPGAFAQTRSAAEIDKEIAAVKQQMGMKEKELKQTHAELEQMQQRVEALEKEKAAAK